VYWGSHGCDLERGHEGDCRCSCCGCSDHVGHPEPGCVGAAPYYGPETRFYGEDAAARGLLLPDAEPLSVRTVPAIDLPLDLRCADCGREQGHLPTCEAVRPELEAFAAASGLELHRTLSLADWRELTEGEAS
jgi:hypothetical protein